MSKVKSGTKDLKGKLMSGGFNDTRKVRCKCGGFAIAASDGKGGIEYRCQICAIGLRSISLD